MPAAVHVVRAQCVCGAHTAVGALPTLLLPKGILGMVPPPLCAPLLHLQVGINFLMLLYRSKVSGAILADEMGLGKTAQLITYLGALAGACWGCNWARGSGVLQVAKKRGDLHPILLCGCGQSP